MSRVLGTRTLTSRGRGYTDYSTPLPDIQATKEGSIYTLTDLGELAVRLGSPSIYDRRGDIIWWDDFENLPFKWGTTLSGTGAAAARSTANSYIGGASCLLTAGSDASVYAQIFKYLSFNRVSKQGIEVAANFDGDCSQFDFEIRTYDGVNVNSFRIALYPDDTRVQVLSETGGYLERSLTYKMKVEDLTLWHNIKLTLDWENKRYGRLRVGPNLLSLSDISCLTEASGSGAYNLVGIKSYGAAGVNALCYVDNFILTQNEV